ncbi:peptide chain release factor N(5)-glutamine methyltransferase [Tranquillimonas alkanivorans]|uniref:Release factor glutamine methyltransferase n=1 Tax=Tranquillimonas alkanivorans TaxID=441119 RepID=A0A1I5QM44_9RHOB|nr:peptide chain release factor N(5)-glutamine methyltransferase [Tranquillimonas alkanivorans]SFP47339.1 [protein release factor]-glutamine N5-methyltransferase [Tranquillimonas alkanivorans]
MSWTHLLAQAAAELRAAGVPDPMRDARRLLAHALDAPTERLTLLLGDPVEAGAEARFRAAVARRVRREPVSQITGRRAFWGRDFRVSRAVLDPRPETETLVALALDAPFKRVLDIGTGSGCILATLLAERPGARGTGTDVSDEALEVAAENAARLGVAGRAEFRRTEWARDVAGPFDLIVSNPPYIAAAEMPDLSPEVREWEPRLALTDGGDGLTAYRAIADQAPALLGPGGRLIVEIGPTQGAQVAALFVEGGLEEVRLHHDLDGRDRCVSARHA